MNVWTEPTAASRRYFANATILLILLDLPAPPFDAPISLTARKWHLLSEVVQRSGSMVLTMAGALGNQRGEIGLPLIPQSLRSRKNPYLLIAGCERDGVAMQLLLQAKQLGIPVSLVHDALCVDGKPPAARMSRVPTAPGAAPMYVTTAEVLGWLLFSDED